MRQIAVAGVALFVAIALHFAYRDAAPLRDETVVVVGAGAAGVAAAVQLQHLGAQVLLLEASERIGGRVMPALDPQSGAVVGELGAWFMHCRGLPCDAADPSDAARLHPLAQLLDAAGNAHGIRRHHYDYADGTYFDADGQRFTHAEWREGRDCFVENLFDAAYEYAWDSSTAAATAAFQDQPLSVTLDDIGAYARLGPRQQRLFDLLCFQHVVQDMQAPLQEISTAHFDGSAHSSILATDDFLVSGSIAQLLMWMLVNASAVVTDECGIGANAPLSVLLRTPVSEIRTVQQEEAAAGEVPFDFVCEWWTGVFWGDDSADGTTSRAARAAFDLLAALDHITCVGHRALRAVACSLRLAGCGRPVTVAASCGAPTRQVAFGADRVVVAVPLGVLKGCVARATGAGNTPSDAVIRFTPALPAYLIEAISDLRTNGAHRVIMCWDPAEVFWPSGDAPGASFFFKFAHPTLNTTATSTYGKGEHLEFVNVHKFLRNGCLGVGAEGAFATRLERMKDEAATRRILADLALMFPHATPLPPPRRTFRSRWGSAPEFRGGYSSHGVDSGPAHRREFHHPVNDKVFFAGEHCDEVHYGTIHGAYYSGVAAAMAVGKAAAHSRVMRAIVWTLLGAPLALALTSLATRLLR